MKTPMSMEEITRAFETERKIDRKALGPDDIPVRYEAITSEWLTHVLCKGHPGAEVVSFSLDEPDHGTTDRRRIFVSYNAAGAAAKLPTSVFCKSANQLHTRLLNARGGLIQGEVAFYKKYRDVLSLPAPKSFLAIYDSHSFNCIIVLNDLSREGAQFCSHDTDMPQTRAESQMSMLAQLHGRGFDSGLVADADDIFNFEELFANIDAFLNWKDHCTRGFIGAEEVIPPRLFKRQREIWSKTRQSVALHAALPRTFTHNDVHIRNWYIASDGQMTLCDWQCFGKAHWCRDVAYAISTALPVEKRRAWEQDLLQYYLDRLRAFGGPKVPLEEAWTFYRQHLLSVLAFWTSTLAFEISHPQASSIELIKRIATAMDDHAAMDSLG